MVITTEEYTNEVIRVFEEFLGRVQQLSVTELEDDVQRVLVHIVNNDNLADACVTMMPLHSYLLYRSTYSDCNIRWFGDFLDIVCNMVTSGCTKEDFEFYAVHAIEHQKTAVMPRLCAAALLRYNANNPSEKEEA